MYNDDHTLQHIVYTTYNALLLLAVRSHIQDSSAFLKRKIDRFYFQKLYHHLLTDLHL